MADVKISELPDGSTIQSGDQIPVNRSGTTRRVTIGGTLGTAAFTDVTAERAATATLTNKTLTAPVINSPTGLVKADVGLGNVDNTSNATERAATATLTNKTLTSPVINTPTGIVKGDVGLGNVDNTSNATERAATATLTNKTISGASNTLSAIALSSMASIADQTILGNVSGSSAAPVALTSAQLAGLIGGITSTWAARGSGSVVGEIKRISDIGPTGGTRMMWDGTYWRLIAPLEIVHSVTPATGTTSTSEQILQQATLPAGLLRAGRSLIISAVFSKSGTTDSATSLLRLGSAGTTSDLQLMSAAIGAGSRTSAPQIGLVVTSATQLRIKGAQSGTLAWSSTAVSATYPQNLTIPDIDSTALILSANMTMSGTSNTPTVAHLFLELIP